MMISRHKQRGFSLVEILIALGIFLIGMVAIVSLFPAAAILQRETTHEVIGEMAAQSAGAIIDANRLNSSDLTGYTTFAGPDGTDVVLLRNAMGNATFNNAFPFTVRSYPTALVNGTDVSNCDLFWVPLIQDLNGDAANPNWVMRLFILRSDSRATYTGGANTSDPSNNEPTNFPKLRSVTVSSISTNNILDDTYNLAAGTDLEVGDLVMDNNGNYHDVLEINGNAITVPNTIYPTPSNVRTLWYAPRGTNGINSPAESVITVKVNIGAG